MKTLDGIQQGSAEWLSHRHAHFNASDAPAMMGVSLYKTRSQLLHEMHTGIVPDVDAATQRRFDDGHRFEALARPVAENIIGEELFPVVGFDGKLSASFDGITMCEDVIWEHKTLNNNLRDLVFAEANAKHVLPDQYLIQMEQQLLVSGANRCLFMASTWDESESLVEEKHCWYESDAELRERIIAGWERFNKDLAAYAHVETAERPKAEVVIDLPALFVHAKGEITEHNMEAFGLALSTRLAEVRAIALVTDQDFSNAKGAAKKFRETAKAIGLSKEAMLAQTETIGEAARKMDAWAKDLNATALQLEKDVEREDMAKKTAMVNEAKAALAAHVDALLAEIKPITLNLKAPNFAESLKAKRNYASMQDAVDTALANAIIEADSVAKDIRGKFAWFRENALSHNFLFHDLQTIIAKAEDDFRLLVATRINEHKQAEAAKLEAERQRIQQEEEAKALAKVRAEQEAKAQEEAERVALENAEAKKAADADEAARKVAEKKPADNPAEPISVAEPVKLAEVPKTSAPTLAEVLHTAAPAAIAQAIHPARPTDSQIIGHLAVHYSVSEQTVRGWLKDMDLHQKQIAA